MNKSKEKNKEELELIEARKQEMESILPNFYTIFHGEKIPSKKINIGVRRQQNE